MTRSRTFLKRVRRIYTEGGPGELLRRAPGHVRKQLPVGLWPPLLLDPRDAADDVVRLPERAPLDVEYRGRFEDSLPRQLSNFLGRIDAPENAVYVFEDAEVVGRNPVARVDGRVLLPSWFGVDTPFFRHQNVFLKRNYPLSRVLRDALFDPGPDRRVDSGFLLLTERGSGRYGWFHETLPKLKWYEQYCELVGESPPLILHSPLEPFQRTSLRLMGYHPDDWIEHSPGVTRVNRLALAPHPIRLEGNPSSGFASELGWVGDRILGNLPESDASFPDRVYVSRADAHRRRVRNEEEVVELLERKGFERFEPGRLSLQEQAELFAGAETIVGLHGLAFYNLLFCSEGTNLVELFAEDGVDESYFVAANELGVHYEFVVCESVHDGENERPINRDVHVDLDRLETVVDDVMASTASPTP